MFWPLAAVGLFCVKNSMVNVTLGSVNAEQNAQNILVCLSFWKLFKATRTNTFALALSRFSNPLLLSALNMAVDRVLELGQLIEGI